MRRVKYWEIASRLELRLGLSGDSKGCTIWIVDAHGYGKRFIVRADEKLTAFVELERAIHEFAVSLLLSQPRTAVSAAEKPTASREV